MTQTLEEVALNRTQEVAKRNQEVAKLITEWNVQFVKDGADCGGFVALTNSLIRKGSVHSIALFKAWDSAELVDYRWEFWNEDYNVWYVSELTFESTGEEVLTFMDRCLRMMDSIT